jgi:hypothetical protein
MLGALRGNNDAALSAGDVLCSISTTNSFYMLSTVAYFVMRDRSQRPKPGVIMVR